jgi:hypothetical protein
MTPILEPILAGLTVSLINKYIVNNNCLWLWLSCSSLRDLPGLCPCSPPPIEIDGHEDDLSSSNTTVSDISLENPHVHIH